jgi:hypothetical protein
VPVLTPAAVAVFEQLARWRAARAFHPRGALFSGHVSLAAPPDGPSPTLAALGGPAEHPALIRISKGVGTAGSRADLLGLAFRITDLPDGPVDLLFSTVGRHRVTRTVFAVVRGWCARPYSTVLPYRADAVLLRLGLEPREPDRARGTDPQVVRDAVRDRPLEFTITEKRRRTGWTPIGRLRLVLPMPDGAVDDGPGGTEPVSFDPVAHAHPRLRPIRFLAALRAGAYIGSRRGRGAPDLAPDAIPAPVPADAVSADR